MTPKEKAKELVDRIFCMMPYINSEDLNTNTAKLCAIIVVDEIIDNLPRKNTNSELWYWQQVQQEIKNL